MIKVIGFILLFTLSSTFGDEADSSSEKGRQKRLLFYDEDGNLVKTFTNPYLRDFAMRADKMPLYGNFMNPFYAFIRATYGGLSSAFAIPVSNEIIEKIQSDPSFQLRLAVEPKKDTAIGTNPLCEGKRTQIPSPLHCNTFLNCWDGWSYEQDCPQGLLFSREGYCDYSENVDCRNREILIKPVLISPPTQEQQPQPISQPIIPPLSQSPVQSTTPSPQPLLPCMLQNSPQQLNSGPTSQLPQKQILPLDPAHLQLLAEQTSQLQSSSEQSLQQQMQPMSKCIEEYKTYRSTNNCKEFYMCVDGKLNKFVCTGDLVFSQVAGLCLPMGLVDCGATPIIYLPALYKIETLSPNYIPAYIKID